MPDAVAALPTEAALHAYVRDALCGHDHLDPEQTPFFRAPVKRGKRRAAVLFHVEGPRLLQTSALWVVDENRILFYDSAGERFGETRLIESPS